MKALMNFDAKILKIYFSAPVLMGIREFVRRVKDEELRGMEKELKVIS